MKYLAAFGFWIVILSVMVGVGVVYLLFYTPKKTIEEELGEVRGALEQFRMEFKREIESWGENLKRFVRRWRSD